ncbi:MAG: ROK family protein [Streptococcaceae bacterium]|jgi:predicted NBD/HSP70 family sugar kinase|nr:ROK family protein [Streptococcaceae bacterium]
MYLAYDIGGTNIKYGLVSSAGEIIKKGKIATPQTEKPFLKLLSDLTAYFQKDNPIEGIGVSAPGSISPDGIVVNFGALVNLYGLELRRKLSERTGLPVTVENDANCCAIAEKWQGAAQETANYLVMVLGTGVGGGIVINHELYRGTHGLAGEFGWSLTNGITAAGDLEDISQNFQSSVVLGLINNYNKAENKKEIEDAKVIVDLVKSGDRVATAVFEEFLTNIAVNLLNLTAYFDPEVILIGGGISANDFFMEKLQEKWLELIKRHTALNRIREQGQLTEIKRAKLMNDAGMIGAAYIIKKMIEEL